MSPDPPPPPDVDPVRRSGAARPDRLRLVSGALVALAVVAASCVGCATNFRTMRRPAPGATAPTTASSFVPTSQAAINTTPPKLFVLNSPGFTAGGSIPATYTCDGAGTSPPLTWSDVPTNAVELVLVVTDPQADNAVQWLVAGISPTSTGVAADATPPGAIVLANTHGTHAYAPLCPAAGQDDTFEFTLYALPKASGLTSTASPTAAVALVSGAAGGTEAVLTGDYQRP